MSPWCSSFLEIGPGEEESADGDNDGGERTPDADAACLQGQRSGLVGTLSHLSGLRVADWFRQGALERGSVAQVPTCSASCMTIAGSVVRRATAITAMQAPPAIAASIPVRQSPSLISCPAN